MLFIISIIWNSKTKKSARDFGDPDPGHGPVFGGFLLRNERSSVIVRGDQIIQIQIALFLRVTKQVSNSSSTRCQKDKCKKCVKCAAKQWLSVAMSH